MVDQDDEIRPIPAKLEKPAANHAGSVKSVESSDVESYLAGEERIEPTDEELAKLRRVSEIIPLRAWYS
jgi:hypothetical protein